MQTKPNKGQRADEGDTFLGVSKARLSALPSNVRGEVVAALTEADDARRSGDARREAAATERVRKALGALDEHHAGLIAEKFFLESLRPLSGDHDVMRKFAKRAGVEG